MVCVPEFSQDLSGNLLSGTIPPKVSEAPVRSDIGDISRCTCTLHIALWPREVEKTLAAQQFILGVRSCVDFFVCSRVSASEQCVDNELTLKESRYLFAFFTVLDHTSRNSTTGNRTHAVVLLTPRKLRPEQGLPNSLTTLTIFNNHLTGDLNLILANPDDQR